MLPIVEISCSKFKNIVGYVLLYKNKLLNQVFGKNTNEKVLGRRNY